MYVVLILLPLDFFLLPSTDHVRADHYDKRCGGSVYNTTKALTSLSEVSTVCS